MAVGVALTDIIGIKRKKELKGWFLPQDCILLDHVVLYQLVFSEDYETTLVSGSLKNIRLIFARIASV